MTTILDINADDWKTEVLESPTLVVVCFYHDECPWSRELNPIIEKVAGEYAGRIRFVRVNVLLRKENMQVALRHGVRSVPALNFFYMGRHVETIFGLVEGSFLRHILDEALEMHRKRAKQCTILEATS